MNTGMKQRFQGGGAPPPGQNETFFIDYMPTPEIAINGANLQPLSFRAEIRRVSGEARNELNKLLIRVSGAGLKVHPGHDGRAAIVWEIREAGRVIRSVAECLLLAERELAGGDFVIEEEWQVFNVSGAETTA
jgi:hypothetical protein